MLLNLHTKASILITGVVVVGVMALQSVASATAPNGSRSQAAASSQSQCPPGDIYGMPCELFNPSALAVDPIAGDVYIADSGNARVMKFSSSGAFLAELSKPPNGALSPVGGIAVSHSQHVYVGNGQDVLVYDFRGTYGSELRWPGGQAGKVGGEGGIAIDLGSGAIYVVQSNFVMDFGPSGNYMGQFALPAPAPEVEPEPVRLEAAAVDVATHDIYVTDGSQDRVYKFNAAGTLLGHFGGSGRGNGQFQNPSGVAVDSKGNVYVTDPVENRVQKFNSSGIYLGDLGSAGSGSGQYRIPMDVAVGPSGQIYVLDVGHGRVDEFTASGAPLGQFGPTSSTVGHSMACVVPKLVGLSLPAARKKLRKAHCRLGKVVGKKVVGKSGQVLRQRPKPGTKRRGASKVMVTIGHHR